MVIIDSDLQELEKKFKQSQQDLNDFYNWFYNQKNGELLGEEPNRQLRSEKKHKYRQELMKFLKSKKKFLNDDGSSKFVLFTSPGEYALGLVLELFRLEDFQTQTYLQTKTVDFYVPRLQLIIEYDGKHHYANKYGVVRFANIEGTLQEMRTFQKCGFKIYRYLSLEVCYHNNEKVPPELLISFLNTFADDILNLLQNGDDIEWVRSIRDNSLKLLEASK